MSFSRKHTDETRAYVKAEYIDKGRPASDVGRELGISRNGVIGLAHRAGWYRSDAVALANVRSSKWRSQPPRPRAPRPPPPSPAARVFDFSGHPRPDAPKTAAPMAMPADEGAPGQGLRIIDPGFRGCRYPISGQSDETRFCCEPTTRVPDQGGKPIPHTYCIRHHRIAYQPDTKRKAPSAVKDGNVTSAEPDSDEAAPIDQVIAA